MTTEEAIRILELHNQWRKGAEIPMENPVRLGMAIDIVVCELKSLLETQKTCPNCGRKFSETEVPSGKFCCDACEYGY